MEPIKLKNLTAYGELAMRTNLNFARLETSKYWPENIFEMDQHAWPADWEGRTMLALTMHAQTTGRTPAFLDEILEAIPGRLNEKGYIGPVYDEGVTHEQAMAGHSWMLRALVEYFKWKQHDEPEMADKAMHLIRKIIEGLYLPQEANYRDYPTKSPERYEDARWILSHKQSKTKTHAGTSDCGCAFIAIDGATAVYELTEGEALKSLIETMIASYKSLPREELHVQTHATLSGIRGILRFFRTCGERKYLDLVVEVFDLYKTKAWTEHYANYNWFGLPRWTEPCAVIDSFIISQELWVATGIEGYLHDAHHILYNAIAHAERVNGTFGTDLCVGAKVKPPKETGGIDSHECDQAIVHAKALTYEVFWCCNMRGGDGISRAHEFAIYTDGNSVVFPYYHTCKAELELQEGHLKIAQKADYPASGEVRFNVLENSAGEVTLRFFAPEAWTLGPKARVLHNGKPLDTSYENGLLSVTAALVAGDEILLDNEIQFHISDGNVCVNNSKEHFSFRHGPMMLGVKSVLQNAEDEMIEVDIERQAACKSVGKGRYETVTKDGTPVLLQPMWGKENLIEPLDIYQVLFAK